MWWKALSKKEKQLAVDELRGTKVWMVIEGWFEEEIRIAQRHVLYGEPEKALEERGRMRAYEDFLKWVRLPRFDYNSGEPDTARKEEQ